MVHFSSLNHTPKDAIDNPAVLVYTNYEHMLIITRKTQEVTPMAKIFVGTNTPEREQDVPGSP